MHQLQWQQCYSGYVELNILTSYLISNIVNGLILSLSDELCDFIFGRMNAM